METSHAGPTPAHCASVATFAASAKSDESPVMADLTLLGLPITYAAPSLDEGEPASCA